MIFFVYKITVKKLGVFYFGVTNNIDRRKSDHITQINFYIRMLKYNRHKKMRTNSFHSVVAQQIIKGLRSTRIGDTKIGKEIIMTVLDIKDTSLEASEMERNLLTMHKNNPKCFNSPNSSCYPKNRR